MRNDVKEYDIEVYGNYFNCGIKDFKTKEILNLEISEEFDHREEIYKFFSSYNGYLIGFNTIHYDNLIIKFYLKEWNYLNKLSKDRLLIELKKHSDRVINDEFNFDYLKRYRYFQTNWIDIDLFLYWSKMLRISKKISLKSLGIQLNFPIVQELPFTPDKILNLKEIRELRRYNNENDLGILDLLAVKMLPDITLRKEIKRDYNIDCMSLDAIKIASEALLQDYCKETKENYSEVKSRRFPLQTIVIKDILSEFNPDFKLKIFQDLFERVLNSVNNFNEELIVNENNTSLLLSYGTGGLHNLFENKMYNSSETHYIVDSDFASLYPNLMINYDCFRYPELTRRFEQIKFERIAAKKAKRKGEDTFKKLVLNG